MNADTGEIAGLVVGALLLLAFLTVLILVIIYLYR